MPIPPNMKLALPSDVISLFESSSAPSRPRRPLLKPDECGPDYQPYMLSPSQVPCGDDDSARSNQYPTSLKKTIRNAAVSSLPSSLTKTMRYAAVSDIMSTSSSSPTMSSSSPMSSPHPLPVFDRSLNRRRVAPSRPPPSLQHPPSSPVPGSAAADWAATVEGFAECYLHAPPPLIGRALLDALARPSSAPQAAPPSSPSSLLSEVLLLPLAAAEGGGGGEEGEGGGGGAGVEGGVLLFYKALRHDVSAVAEIMCRAALVEGEGGEDGASALYFESGEEDEATLSVKARAMLEERRKAVAEKFTIVPGEEVGVIFLTRDSIGLTRASFSFKGQYGLELPEAARRKLLKRVFSPLSVLQSKHECCQVVDTANQQNFINVTVPSSPPLTLDEQAFLGEHARLIEAGAAGTKDGEEWERLRGSVAKHPTLGMFFRRDKRGLVWGKAAGRVDASAERTAAYLWDFSSYARIGVFKKENGNLLRYESGPPGPSRSKVMAAAKRFHKGVEKRLFESWWLWDRQCLPDVDSTETNPTSFVLAFGPAEEYETPRAWLRTNVTSQYVRGKTRGVYKLTPVATNICDVTLVQTASLGGNIPSWVTTMSLSGHLLAVANLQAVFSRADRIVDKEVRGTIAAKMRGCVVAVSSGEEQMRETCDSFKKDFYSRNGRKLFKAVKPDSPFVEMFVRTNASAGKTLRGGNCVATSLVDAEVEEAAAWIFDFAARERMRINVEKDNLPRLCIPSDTTPHCNHVLTIRRPPFPLSIRVFQTKMLWIKPSVDEITVYFVPSDKVIDFGGLNFRDSMRGPVEGLSTGLWSIRRARSNICSVELFQSIEFGGHIPASIVPINVLSASLSAAKELRDKFMRDDDVDAEDRKMLTEEMMSAKDSGLSEEEQEIFNSVDIAAQIVGFAKCRFVGGGADHFVKTSCFSNIYVAEVIVDAEIVDCVAWEVLKCGRQRTRSFFDDGGAFKSERVFTSRWRETSEIYLGDSHGAGSNRRQIKSETVWKGDKDGAHYIVAERNKGDELDRVKTISRRIRRISQRVMGQHAPSDSKVSKTSFDVVESLAITPPQTRVVVKFTCGGAQRGTALLSDDERALTTVRHLSAMRSYFDRSFDVDRIRREMFCANVTADGDTYTKSEVDLLTTGIAYFSAFEKVGNSRVKELNMTPPTTKAVIFTEPGTVRVWGRSMAWVRADSAQVLAWLFDFTSRARTLPEDLERAVYETVNPHNSITYVKKRTHGVLQRPRDYLHRTVWRATGVGNFEYVSSPEENELKWPRLRNVVRAKLPQALRITRVGDSEAKVELALNPDAVGETPAFLVPFTMGQHLSFVRDIQFYFQCLRRFQDYDEKDGASLGETFMLKTKEERVKKKGERKYKYTIRVSRIVNKYVGLKSFAAENPWFPPLVEGMLSRQFHDFFVLNTKLDNLSVKEARAIGSTLTLALFDRQLAEDGVDMFIHEYKCLGELHKRHRFFASMAGAIAQRKLEQAPWGLALKVGTGALLCISDLATDLYAISSFTLQGKHGYAIAVILSVSISMLAQCCLVWLNGRNRGLKHVANEALLALSGMKPAVDAFRMISGAKQHTNDELDLQLEMSFSRTIELVAESIPSALVQTYSLFTSGSTTSSSVVSIIISLLTISFGVTTLSFDFDLSTSRRAEFPQFYGYVPKKSGPRTAVFYLMLIFTMCQVTMRVLGTALLLAVSPLLTVAFLGGDVLFFFTCKAFRKDLRYWLRLSGAASWFFSIFLRLCCKLMVDFTVMVQLRHPQEIGGFLWIASLLFGQFISFISVHIYCRLSDSEVTDDHCRNMWVATGALEALFIASFCVFATSIERSYLGTFISTATGKKYNQDAFRSAVSDRIKIQIFHVHPSYYSDILDEVDQWLKEQYWTWCEEEPDWFSTVLKATIPIDMIPKYQVGGKSTIVT